MKKHSPSSPVMLRAVAAVAVIALLSGNLLADDKQPGRVFGKVVDSKDKPASGIVIQLTSFARQVGGKGGARGTKSVFHVPEFRHLMFQSPAGKTTTDATGAFEFKALPPGGYLYEAGDPYTVGYHSGTFKVAPAASVEVNIKLEEPTAPQ